MRFKSDNCFVASFFKFLSSLYAIQFRTALNIAFTHVAAT